ncbi:pantoate--beta-alanine ligase [Nocardioides dubius]|uniref:Pantothenate synthetase n=1 Tax=Nocardioides dubius TaxID=317019 RepID=A0ABP4E9C5_9ACTN
MPTPVLVSTRAELVEALAERRGRGQQVGLVPTMGALHEGHGALMETARAAVGDGPVVVSIFVNPLQFGAGEDLDRYPRTLDADLELCGAHGVDVVFAPSVAEVYPGGDPQVTVEPGPLGSVLEGATRPGHYRGVLTVVAKLFGLVRPDVAVFGQKDYQQLVLIRRMVSDLCLGVEIVGAETVREPDGLALSSRNRYLSAREREQAVALNRVLRRAISDAGLGPDSALGAGRAELRRANGVDLDYLVVTDPDLGPAPAQGEGRILIAARVGTTRLIDNLPIHLGAPSPTRTSPNDTEGDS